MSQTPLVTVIMSVYNAGAFLRPAIASVLAQTYPHFELLVIDDGSTDGCVADVRDIHDDRIVWLHQENKGKPSAMNAALAVARGDFYAIQDADDLAHPRRLERQVACMRDNPDVAAVFCGHELILDGLHTAPRFRAKSREECRHDISVFRMPGHDPTVMYRLSAVRGMEYEPTFWAGEGYDYILRVGEQHPMLVIGECLYSYRVHSTSVTKRDPERRDRLVREVLRRACDRRGLCFEDLFPPETQHRRGNRYADNNIASDFIESAIDLRGAQRRWDALRTGLRCAKLRPTDPHYYKALVYSLAPFSVITAVRSKREAKRRAEVVGAA